MRRNFAQRSLCARLQRAAKVGVSSSAPTSWRASGGHSGNSTVCVPRTCPSAEADQDGHGAPHDQRGHDQLHHHNCFPKTFAAVFRSLRVDAYPGSSICAISPARTDDEREISSPSVANGPAQRFGCTPRRASRNRIARDRRHVCASSRAHDHGVRVTAAVLTAGRAGSLGVDVPVAYERSLGIGSCRSAPRRAGIAPHRTRAGVRAT